MVHAFQYCSNGWVPAIEGALVAIQILGHSSVRQARLAADDCIHNLVAHSACVCREFDEDTERQAVHLGLQATDIMRQTGWQHWDYPVWEIDAGATLGRLTVHGTAFVDVKTQVSNVHAEPHMPIGEEF